MREEANEQWDRGRITRPCAKRQGGRARAGSTTQQRKQNWKTRSYPGHEAPQSVSQSMTTSWVLHEKQLLGQVKSAGHAELLHGVAATPAYSMDVAIASHTSHLPVPMVKGKKFCVFGVSCAK